MSGHHHDHDHDHGHAHGHHHHHHASLNKAVWLTALFALVELGGGLFSGSLALLADAGHMASDIVALGLALMASRIASRPANARMSYGYGRAKLLAAQANGLALWFISGWIAWEAYQRLTSPHTVKGMVLLAIAALGLAVNLVILRWLHGEEDVNARAAFWHVLGDAVGSIAAIVAGVVILLTGWMPIDPVLSFLVAGILIWGGWRLLRETTLELMESVPPGFHVHELQAALDAAEGVAGTHHVHVWRLPNGKVALSAHIEIEAMARWDSILPTLLATLKGLGVSHATLQPEIACPDDHC